MATQPHPTTHTPAAPNAPAHPQHQPDPPPAAEKADLTPDTGLPSFKLSQGERGEWQYSRPAFFDALAIDVNNLPTWVTTREQAEEAIRRRWPEATFEAGEGKADDKKADEKKAEEKKPAA